MNKPYTLKIMSEQCDQCLFSANRIVSGKRAKQVIQDCLKTDTHFQCHKATIAGENVACKGFVDTFAGDVFPVRLALILGLVEYVQPNAGSRPVADEAGGE